MIDAKPQLACQLLLELVPFYQKLNMLTLAMPSTQQPEREVAAKPIERPLFFPVQSKGVKHDPATRQQRLQDLFRARWWPGDSRVLG